MRKFFLLMTMAAIIPFGDGGLAHAQHAGHAGHGGEIATRPAACLTNDSMPSVLCAEVPSPTFDAQGALWVTWTQNEHVYVARSDDQGQTFATPTRVTAQPMAVEKNGENRPKSAIAPNGDVYVTFAVKGEKKFTGVVYFSRSLDGAKTFSAPRPISDEATLVSQRFDIIKVAPDGRIFIAWLDKRDLAAAKSAKRDYRGAALYSAVSHDRGETFTANMNGADHSCECCRVAMDIAPDGLPVMVWRHVFEPTMRDHAIMKLQSDGTPGDVHRLSVDNWNLDGCPHHGPSISINDDGVQHVTWFTGGDARQGVFYARSHDGGRTFSDPLALGKVENQASHASVIAVGARVFVTWKEFSGEADEIYVMNSADNGTTWSQPMRVAATADASDYPFLIQDGRWVYVSWSSAIEGLRVFKVMAL